MAKLASLQSDVDALPTKGERVVRATALFKNKSNATFEDVKSKLKAASHHDESCYYCERDRFRDIEHIFPKRHYPERAFDWSNYVYACVICNQDRKGDKFGVIMKNGTVSEFDRNSLDIDSTPPDGIPLIIDVRSENPMDFLKMDLETGLFVAIGNATQRTRGSWTRDLFGLDDAGLGRIRRQNAHHIMAYLQELEAALAQPDQDKADRIRSEISALPYPTVLEEMLRQAQPQSRMSELLKLL